MNSANTTTTVSLDEKYARAAADALKAASMHYTKEDWDETARNTREAAEAMQSAADAFGGFTADMSQSRARGIANAIGIAVSRTDELADHTETHARIAREDIRSAADLKE